MRSNVQVLLAHKGAREKRKISVRTAAEETGVSYYTLNAIVRETIKAYPKDVLVKLCEYFQCDVGDILSIVEIPND